MAKLSVHEYFNNLRALGQELAEENMPLEIAARDTTAMAFNRIFIDGKDVNGGKNKYNDTNPLYANPNLLPRKVQPKGKYGDTGNVGKKPRKTAYFESYMKLRQEMGVNVKYVDLFFTGRLGFNFVNSSVSTSESTMSNRAVGEKDIHLERISKLRYVIRLSDDNLKKARGNEKRFNTKIFSLSKEELENFKRVLKFETIRLMNA